MFKARIFFLVFLSRPNHHAPPRGVTPPNHGNKTWSRLNFKPYFRTKGKSLLKIPGNCYIFIRRDPTEKNGGSKAKRDQKMSKGSELIRKAVDYLVFCQSMSCGHCVPCRLGLPRMLQIMTTLAEDQHAEVERERLEILIPTMCKASLCPVGQTSPLPIKAILEILQDDQKETIDIEEKLEIVQCRSCGHPFAFKAFLEYFRSNVDKSLGVHLVRDYCPECVRKVWAQNMVGELGQ
jgi:hypothetical protein